MDSKRLVATVVGGIVLLVTGYVIFNMLLMDFYTANVGTATGVDRDAPVVWALIVGNLLYAALITYAIGQRGAANITEGAMVGAIVGLLLWGTADITLYGFSNIANMTRTLVDPIVELVHGGLGGAVIAAMLRSGTKAT